MGRGGAHRQDRGGDPASGRRADPAHPPGDGRTRGTRRARRTGRGLFGVPPEEFHAAAARRAERWPDAMTTLSTHDTKRSEDVRARLAVLSEIPDEWHAALSRWAALAPVPEADFAALLWQTVAGAWPI